MRRNVCRHADRNTVRSVDKKIRDAARKHFRLHRRFIKVGHEIDGILLDVRHHLRRHFGEFRFRITHCCGAVPVNRTEISVSLDKRISGIERLRETHHGVINGRIAVRMIFTEAVADDAGALSVGFVRLETELIHGVQDPPVNRFQTVTHIRKRTVDDDRHRIRDEAGLHLRFQIVLDNMIVIFSCAFAHESFFPFQ